MVVVPLSTGARPASFRPEIIVHGKVTRALPDQVRTIDKQKLKEYQENVVGASFFLALKISLKELFALFECE